MAPKVLVVDDDESVLDMVRGHLGRAGFSLLTAGDAPEALRLIHAHRPDLVVLDRGLPGQDGLDLCRQLRQDPATARLPIILLTGLTEPTDRVVGLEVGADDYVTKPFHVRELVARVRALLRRSSTPTDTGRRRAGRIELDEETHEVAVAGAAVSLTSKEFGLLRALLEARGRLLTRVQLMERVWGHPAATGIVSRTLDVHVRRLRQKLGAEATRVVTVKGEGYRLDPD